MVFLLLQDKKDVEVEVTNEEKIVHSRYLLQGLLPYFKRLNEEQVDERELEAKIRGMSAYQYEIIRAPVYEIPFCLLAP